MIFAALILAATSLATMSPRGVRGAGATPSAEDRGGRGAGSAAGQDVACSDETDAGGGAANWYPGLHCFELIPTAAVPDARGTVELGRAASPFGVAVSRDGTQRYALTLSLEGLPAPSSIGPYTSYVAWATTPLLRPMIKLGEVENGRAGVGGVALDKFLVLITAEASADVVERRGRIVLRGASPSMRMQPHDLAAALSAVVGGAVEGQGEGQGHGHGQVQVQGDARTAHPSDVWVAPPMHPAVSMPPGLMRVRPDVSPFLPGSGIDPATIPAARPREVVGLADGDTLRLTAGLVRRTINGRTFTMYGFNGQYPGPLIRVEQNSTIVVDFHNQIRHPTAVHWHGIRLDNRYDGVPGVTQEPVLPGESFIYHVKFPDAGIYWYHPHHREDIQQDLGLYGNMLVESPDADYYSPVNNEEVLILDDLLVGSAGLVPYGRERSTHALMGRFGNVLLVNGEPDYDLEVKRGEVVRFFFTNVSNTRTFNLSFGDARIKVVGSDVGRFEHEEWTESVVIAPAERYIVEVLFDEPGTVALENRVRGIDHIYGSFFPEVDTLGTVAVSAEATTQDHSAAFRTLRWNDAVIAEIDRYRRHFDRPVDHELILTLEVGELPYPLAPLMASEAIYFNPVEWTGTMRVMNWAATANDVHWTLREPSTGRENMEIEWRFEVGDVVKLRLTNDRNAIHAMQHPVHIHGQRFLVLAQDGVENDNLVWKDTMLLPVGSSADILLELSNPGRWMLHCHIAEHLESGMKMVFTVEPQGVSQ